jgi:DNA repair exonuclease SbcCD nuclease subunit
MAKYLLIGDLHFGAKNDSDKHNLQLLEFIDWACEKFADHDQVVQLGDYFDHRTKIQLQTLERAVEGAKRLAGAFGKENTHVIVGNHDLFYLSRLDVTSTRAIEPYVTLIDRVTDLDDGVIATPWVIEGEQWDMVCDLGQSNKYLLAHLELNGFKVNDAYTMEHGHSPKELRYYDKVITGHYHTPQLQKNIQYVGTPIPFTMNEANEDHGVWTLDTDTGDLEFHVYDKVKVISVPYTEIENLPDYDPANTSIRIEFPDDLDDETKISEVVEFFKENDFTEVKVKYQGNKAKEILESDAGEVTDVENIDEVVIRQLASTKPIAGIDIELLQSTYRECIAISQTEE